ncbi:Carbonyl reductase [NADPH] 1 [Halotydeus destructor]|nr:Carbonyl reductase [NADPH] 1 [Halotydeus destructor]
MSKKVAVVTGSNKGIGLSTVKLLCEKFDGDVYLTSRDPLKGQEAVDHLKSEFGVSPKYHQLDIDDEDSVLALKSHLVDTYGGLDILVNNAGIAYATASTAPYIEQATNTLETNFFSTLRACDLLFPVLRPGARVVNLSSFMGLMAKVPCPKLREKLTSEDLTSDDLVGLAKTYLEQVEAGEHQGKGWPTSVYSLSKVLLSALTRVQQRQFEPDTDILVNSVSPGYVNTDMTAHNGPLTPDEGAASSVHAALLPAGSDHRGQFFWQDCSVIDWVTHDMKTS